MPQVSKQLRARRANAASAQRARSDKAIRAAIGLRVKDPQDAMRQKQLADFLSDGYLIVNIPQRRKFTDLGIKRARSALLKVAQNLLQKLKTRGRGIVADPGDNRRLMVLLGLDPMSDDPRLLAAYESWIGRDADAGKGEAGSMEEFRDLLSKNGTSYSQQKAYAERSVTVAQRLFPSLRHTLTTSLVSLPDSQHQDLHFDGSMDRTRSAFLKR